MYVSSGGFSSFPSLFQSTYSASSILVVLAKLRLFDQDTVSYSCSMLYSRMATYKAASNRSDSCRVAQSVVTFAAAPIVSYHQSCKNTWRICDSDKSINIYAHFMSRRFQVRHAVHGAPWVSCSGQMAPWATTAGPGFSTRPSIYASWERFCGHSGRGAKYFETIFCKLQSVYYLKQSFALFWMLTQMAKWNYSVWFCLRLFWVRSISWTPPWKRALVPFMYSQFVNVWWINKCFVRLKWCVFVCFVMVWWKIAFFPHVCVGKRHSYHWGLHRFFHKLLPQELQKVEKISQPADVMRDVGIVLEPCFGNFISAEISSVADGCVVNRVLLSCRYNCAAVNFQCQRKDDGVENPPVCVVWVDVSDKNWVVLGEKSQKQMNGTIARCERVTPSSAKPIVPRASASSVWQQMLNASWKCRVLFHGTCKLERQSVALHPVSIWKGLHWH